MTSVKTRQMGWLIIASFICFCVQGCDPIGPIRGHTVPDARITIELPEPRTLPQLHASFVEVALRGGYPHTTGLTGTRPFAEVASESFGGDQGMFWWVKNPNDSNPYQKEVTFFSNTSVKQGPDAYKRTSNSVEFMYRRARVGSFTKEEWLEFYVFYEEILPEVFREATISIQKNGHPASFTDREILLQIQAETDMEVPEKYLLPDESEKEN